MDKINEVRVGITGVGNMGSAHAECIRRGLIKGMRLSALCDIDKEKLKYQKSISKDIITFESYEKMLESGCIDAVIIAVPHMLHGAVAECAFANGIHVLTEKPADVTVSAARKMNEAAEKSENVFAIMFNQRTDPLFRKARDMIRSGELGEIKRSVWIVTNWYRTQSYYDSGGWRATWRGEGGGVLINQAPHNLDLWQWICGMPESVTAFCHRAKYHNIEVEDSAEIFTKYKNGATGTFITSTGEFPGTNRLEISGTRGKLVIEEGRLRLWHMRTDERELCFDSSADPEKTAVDYSEFLPDTSGTAHRGILQNFADVIINGGELIAKGSEGINSLMISNAAYMSEWSGNKEIVLPFSKKDFDEMLEIRRSESAENNSFYSAHGNRGEDVYNKRWQVRW